MDEIDRRKRYLINPSFQWKMIFYGIFSGVLILGVVHISLLLFFNNLFEMGKQAEIPQGHIYYTFLTEQKMMLYFNFSMASIVILFGAALWWLFISHKIAGPLYQLTNYFENLILDKRIDELVFREKDFFQEIPTVINSYFDKRK